MDKPSNSSSTKKETTKGMTYSLKKNKTKCVTTLLLSLPNSVMVRNTRMILIRILSNILVSMLQSLRIICRSLHIARLV